jgi:hypothetical protein
MALTPELSKLKAKLEELGYAKRTTGQDQMLAELDAIDRTLLRKSLDESTFASVTRMTSPGDGRCNCCGR